MPKRPDFTRKTMLAMWQRCGGPDAPRCECDRTLEVQRGEIPGCGGQLITKSDPAQYHHIVEAETGDDRDAERWAWLRSAENGAVLRRSCHGLITAKSTARKVAKSRHQREREANIKKPKKGRSSFLTSRDGPYRRTLDGRTVKR